LGSSLIRTHFERVGFSAQEQSLVAFRIPYRAGKKKDFFFSSSSKETKLARLKLS
jgi:hypothetical protein